MSGKRAVRPRKEQPIEKRGRDEEFAKRTISRNHEERKEFAVVKFDGDGETEKFPIKAATLDLWELADGEEYGETLQEGDLIHVKAPTAIDPKRRRYPARVIFITDSKEKAAAVAKKEGPRGKVDPKSPSKLREQRRLLNKLKLTNGDDDHDADASKTQTPASERTSSPTSAKYGSSETSQGLSGFELGGNVENKNKVQKAIQTRGTENDSDAETASSTRSESPATREAWKDYKEIRNGTYDASGLKVYYNGEWLYRWDKDVPPEDNYLGPTQPGPDPRNRYSREDPSDERLWRHARPVVPEGYQTPSSCFSSPGSVGGAERTKETTKSVSSSSKKQKPGSDENSRRGTGLLQTPTRTKPRGGARKSLLFTPTPPKTSSQVEAGYEDRARSVFLYKDWYTDVLNKEQAGNRLDRSFAPSPPDVRKKLSFSKSPKTPKQKQPPATGIRDAMVRKKIHKNSGRRIANYLIDEPKQRSPVSSESSRSSSEQQTCGSSGKIRGRTRAEPVRKHSHGTSSGKSHGIPYEKRGVETSCGASFRKATKTSYGKRTINPLQEGSSRRSGCVDPETASNKRGREATPQRIARQAAAARQDRLARRIRKEFRTQGKGKTEIFPGAGCYMAAGRLITFETRWHPKKPLQDAVNFAMMVMGSKENIITLFPGNHVGLKTVLEDKGINDILAYVNGSHPYVKRGKLRPVSEKEFVRAFSKRAYYIRSEQKKAPEEEEDGSHQEEEARAGSQPI